MSLFFGFPLQSASVKVSNRWFNCVPQTSCTAMKSPVSTVIGAFVTEYQRFKVQIKL